MFFKQITSNIKGDIFGGVTAGIVALPLALAFGVASGLGPEAGLYGAIFTGVFASIFGGTPSQITGPTGPMTVVVTAYVAEFAIQKGGGPETIIPLLIVTILLAGLIQVLMGVVRIGQYIKYIPYPVISGFMTGIGVIIIAIQLLPMLGVPTDLTPGNPIGVVKNFNLASEYFSITSLSLTLGTIAVIYLFPKITKIIPSTLVALITVSVVAFLFIENVPVLGEMPTGLPMPRLDALKSFNISDLSIVIVPAFMLALLGAIDSLLTSVIADNITKTKHNSNKELVGQGIGNMIAGIFGGIPGAGATMRTVVNVNNGGKTQLSGVVHGALLLTILLGAGPIIMHVPQAVLAGILITVGISIVDYKGLKDLKHIPLSEAVIFIAVLLITVFYNLIVAVGVGLVLAAILFMKKMGDIVDSNTHVSPLEKYNQELIWSDEQSMPTVLRKNVYIIHIDGPLFFGFASRFGELNSTLPDIKYVILRMEKVPYIDQTGLYGLEDAILDLESRGVEILITGIQEQPKDMMSKVKIIPNLIAEEELFKDFQTCLHWLKRALTDSKGKLEENET